jgi:hypothetical protein
MKNQVLRISSMVVLLTSIVATGLICFAQQQERPREPAQEERQPIPELQRLSQTQLLAVEVPRECARLKPVVQMHDVADKFTPPGTSLTLSGPLTGFLNGHGLQPKGYDDPRINKVFADSFKLGNCKVCYATLEVNVRHYGDIWSNDTLTAGAASSTGFTSPLLYTQIWPNGPHTYSLPPNGLNQLIFSGQDLDVIAQDDSDFDFMKLTVWYY